jgi:site-specific recombinase XerC
MVSHLLKGSGESKPLDKRALLFKDPLRQLQQLMGHAHITTTYIYLDYIQEAEDMVDGAMNDWTSSVFGDGDE